MSYSNVAKIYAGSFVEIGNEKNILPELEEELKFLIDLYNDDKDFSSFLTSPDISDNNKSKLIAKVFSGKLHDNTINFFKTIIRNRRLKELNNIYNAVLDEIDKLHNRQKVTVITKEKLEQSAREEISVKLNKTLNKNILIREKIDESILGGIIIKINDLVIDGSLINDLKKLRNNLLFTKVGSEAAYED